MRAKHSRALQALILAAGVTGAASAIAAKAEAPASSPSQPANAVRPEFAGPFNAAQDLVKAGKGPEALAKLKEADALPNKTPYESFLIARVRAPAEYAVGDNAAAATDFETSLASDLLQPVDRLPIMKALSEILYTDKQYARAIGWMQKYAAAGGNDPQITELLAQSLYLNKDYAGAAKAYQAQVDAAYAAGQRPPEKTLRLLASSQSQVEPVDDVAYMKTIEHLAVDYPKNDYWQQLISRAAHVEKFSDRLYVDVYRLKAAVYGQVDKTERLSYAALAMRAGYPAESKHALDDGLAKGMFTGPDLAEATKLQAQAARAAAQDKAQNAANESAAKAAKDGNAAVNLGLLDTLDGNAAQGVALTSLGIDKGGLKFPDEAKLHLGFAQYSAGQNAEALKTFQSVTPAGGVGALAHVWALFVQSKIQAAAAPAAAASTAK